MAYIDQVYGGWGMKHTTIKYSLCFIAWLITLDLSLHGALVAFFFSWCRFIANNVPVCLLEWHYSEFIMRTMAWQITSLTIVYSTIYSRACQRKHQSSASLASVWGIHRWPMNSPHKGPVTRKMFPFDDVIRGEEVTEGLFRLEVLTPIFIDKCTKPNHFPVFVKPKSSVCTWTCSIGCMTNMPE